jgi:hypothetical protein
MDDPSFDARLIRLFAEAPAMADAPAFAARVESKLARGWALRRAMIAVAGVCGGLIALGQVAGSGLLARVDGASRMLEAARRGVEQLPVAPQLSLLADLPFGGEAIWLIIGLAVLAAALFAGRSLEDI